MEQRRTRGGGHRAAQGEAPGGGRRQAPEGERRHQARTEQHRRGGTTLSGCRCTEAAVAPREERAAVTRKQRRTRRGSTTTPAPEHLQRRTCAALPGHALTRVTSHGTKHCSCAARRPKLLARALPALGRPGGGLRMWPPWRRHSTAARAPPRPTVSAWPHGTVARLLPTHHLSPDHCNGDGIDGWDRSS